MDEDRAMEGENFERGASKLGEGGRGRVTSVGRSVGRSVSLSLSQALSPSFSSRYSDSVCLSVRA